MLGKILLWVSAIGFAGYGIACLLDPGLPTGYAGLAMLNGDGRAEVGAMYGGLQTGFGVFCLLGALRGELFRPALLALLVMVGGLALGRAALTLAGGEPVGSYTYGALVYEFATAVLAGVALRGGRGAVPA